MNNDMKATELNMGCVNSRAKQTDKMATPEVNAGVKNGSC